MSTIAATNLKNASSASNNIVLNSDGTTTIASPSNIIKSGTAVASTSGTAIDFTSIPSWVKRITVMFNNVSINGSVFLVQIGSGSITSSGYNSSSALIYAATSIDQQISTAGMVINNRSTAARYFGQMIITLLGSNVYSSNHCLGDSASAQSNVFGGGGVTLSGALDRVRVTTVSGTNTFSTGTINILYEG